jgi:hypothetical protein
MGGGFAAAHSAPVRGQYLLPTALRSQVRSDAAGRLRRCGGATG